MNQDNGDTIVEEREYRIVKIPIPVRVTLETEPALQGELFLLPHMGIRQGRERVIDLLLGPEQFLPLRTTGGITFINKVRIILMEVDEPEDAGIEGPASPFDREIDIALSLIGNAPGGEPLTGRLRISSPSHQARLTDLMNESLPYLSLSVGEGAVIVSKSHVVRLEERARTP